MLVRDPATLAPSAVKVFCASCHQLRVGSGVFVPISPALRAEWERQASHSICPACAQVMYGIDPAEYARLSA